MTKNILVTVIIKFFITAVYMHTSPLQWKSGSCQDQHKEKGGHTTGSTTENDGVGKEWKKMIKWSHTETRGQVRETQRMIDEMMNERISLAENKRSCDEFIQESQKTKER